MLHMLEQHLRDQNILNLSLEDQQILYRYTYYISRHAANINPI